MSTPDPADSLSIPMPEPSRTRSDSLEDSGSQQERKRPRLDSSPIDHLSSEEALTDCGCPATEVPPSKSFSHEGSDNRLAASPAAASATMATSPTGVSSKVTINTRILQTPNRSQESSFPLDSLDIPESSEKSSTDNPSQGEVDSVPEMIHPPRETISITSSPSRSPEIQVAELEDIDQSPAETRWAPITRVASGTDRQQAFPPRYVHRTFPYARANASFGAVNEILPEIATIFQTGSRHRRPPHMRKMLSSIAGNPTDGNVFLEVRTWLSRFLELQVPLSQGFVQEEPDFWADFPDLVAALLRRQYGINSCDVRAFADLVCRVDPPQQARPLDLEEFFVDYARLTLLFVHFDLARLRSASGTTVPEFIPNLTCQHYLPVLSWILSYRDIPFYDILRHSRDYNPANLISSVIDRLAHPASSNVLDSLSIFAERMALFLPKKPNWTSTFIQILTVVSQFARSVPERTLFNADHQYKTSPQVSVILENGLTFFLKIDQILQTAIQKQLPWLTIENSPDFLRIVSGTFQCITEQSPDLGFKIWRTSGIESPEVAPDHLTDIIAYAWKFKTLRKYITTGRMELRVYGMEAMQADLVHVWRCHIQYNIDSLKVPLVRYLVDFIQSTKLVEYIVGVDSHPQLISRSSNVIGFLCVTSTYSEKDSDTIWQTVSESQDPRTITEVLVILKSILHMSQLAAMLYLCGKLLDLPLQRFDSKMLDFVGELLQNIQQKSHPAGRKDGTIDALPFKLFVRLLREASASSVCMPEQKAGIQAFATEQLDCLLRVSDITEDEKSSLWHLCVRDVADMNVYATGSLRALNPWISRNPAVVVPRLADSFDFTRLLIENLAHLVRSSVSASANATFIDTEFAARLRPLSYLLDHTPQTVTAQLREVLWICLFTSPTLDPRAQDSAWDMVSSVTASCKRTRNTFIDSFISDYLPRLQGKDFNSKVLDFVQHSVIYEMRFSGTIQPDDHDIVTIPGIDRIWRLILQAPAGTVETAATNFVIDLYLDHEIILSRPERDVEATHFSLVDRCVQQVISAATRLRSFTDGTMSGEDEAMVIIASEEEMHAEEMRFDRSLLFLRQFLQGMKARPRYSPPPIMTLEKPQKAFQDRGEVFQTSYQTFGGKHAHVPLKKIWIGDLNTGVELAQYLVDLTGFTQFTCISGGQKVELFGNGATLRDLRVGPGLLMIKKVGDTPEKRPEGQERPVSPVDSRVIEHFNELYELLDLEERLAREVFSFLDLFPAQARVRDLIQSRSASPDELLPMDKPYKLLYCAKALRSCIEDEAFSTTPNAEFLKYSIRTITASFNWPQSIQSGQSLQLHIAYVLAECLLLALRAPVSPEVSSSYISDPEAYTRYLSQMLNKAQMSGGLESPIIAVHLLVREPFAALVEGTLHDERLWQSWQTDSLCGRLLKRMLLDDARAEVRKVIADVIFGLTGPWGTKLLFKPVDPRSARSRFPPGKIEASLSHWWNVMIDLLPAAVAKPTQCQQLFEVSLATLRNVGKSVSASDLRLYFQSWSGNLLQYQHTEV